MSTDETYTTPDDWVGYRRDVKVLDCTIRDGGLMNDSRFSDEVVKAVYQACADGGVDYMEIGYKGSTSVFDPDKYGPWRFSREEDIRRIVGDNDRDLKLSVMADAGKTDYQTDIVPKDQSVIDMIRVACYVHQVPTAVEMIKDAHDKGYETTVNVMAVSTVSEGELEAALKILLDSEVEGVYVVDSFGNMFSEQIARLTIMYAEAAKAKGQAVGVHAHNNLQCAFANTVAAMIAGATFLDCTIGGLGRGAGNCTTELLLGFLHNPKYKLRPILQCLQSHIEPMRQKLKWGYDIPYMVTGFMNRHPRLAMAFKDSESDGDFVGFYDKMLEEN